MNEKEIIIGTINLDDFISESVFDGAFKMKGKGACKIAIYTNEGPNIPHFHLKPEKENDICVRIFYPRLFKHGKHDGVLTTKEARSLNETLDDNHTGLWKKIRDSWVEAFPGIRAQCGDIKQPNYGLLVDEDPDEAGKNMVKIKYEHRNDVYTIDDEVFILAKLASKSDRSCDPKNQLIIIPGLINEPIANIDKVKITEFFYVKTKKNTCEEVWLSNFSKNKVNDEKLEKLLQKIGLEKINFTN